jgi:regulator of cell morphogenesis and NO signaling
MLALQDFNKTVSEIVRADYRTADVFKKYGINYCCGGKLPLTEACVVQNIDIQNLQEELTRATKTISLPNTLQYNQWKVDFLIEYIINVHHEYVKQSIPALEESLLSFINGHLKQHPELSEVQQIFQELVQLVLRNNQQEEEIIFPYIKLIANAYNRKESYGGLFVKTLRKPLSNLEAENNKISSLLNQLRSLTHNYVFPENTCTNHRVVFHKLREFDNDLVQHKHLENNILFPKAVELERELLKMDHT